MAAFELKKDKIYNLLKSDILSGKYLLSPKLPKEILFAKQLGVGQVTLRSALARLEKEDLVVRIPSKGTFVCELKAKKGNTILILTESETEAEHFGNPVQYILPGVEKTAKDFEYNTVRLERSCLEALSTDELPNVLEANGVFGIIALMNGFNGNEKIVEILRVSQKPVVLPHAAAEDHANTGFATIYTPPRDALKEAVSHLAEQGHERVAAITAESKWENDVFRGMTIPEYRNFLSSLGLKNNEELIKHSLFNKKDVEKVVTAWMKMDKPPTAILCFSDFFAVYVYEALKKLNIKIPSQIAVMGYCGYPGGKFMSPSLSTVDFEYEKIGRLSVELLSRSGQWFANGKTATPQIISRHVLRKRESTKIKRLEKNIMEQFYEKV